MFKRILNLADLLDKKSFFLFGPRSTGKSTLLKNEFGEISTINLLLNDTYLSLLARPSLLREMVSAIKAKTPRRRLPIIIDEVQKIPSLLDEVHYLIEEKKYKFILTGSSSRKLKRSGVNLLAGRAWEAQLFPLVSKEIPKFNLKKYLLVGGLPQVYPSKYPREELDAYVNTYLKEEIKEESLVQNLSHFSRFLKFACLANAEQVNFAKMSSDAELPASTIKGYFEILRDTFLGFILEPWKESKKRKAIATAKFYFFDTGVANHLRGIESMTEGSSDFGKSLEHFIAMEIRAYLSYHRIKKELCFWRTLQGDEVDFIIGNEVAIEVKGYRKVNDRDFKGLLKLKEEKILKHFYFVSLDNNERITADEIHIIDVYRFLDLLWSGKLIS